MLQLKCVAQQYEWGKLGSQSAVAQLMVGNYVPIFPIHDSQM